MIFHCKDLGYDCTWHVEGSNPDDMLPEIKAHAAEVHGLSYFKPEAEQNVRTAIEKNG